MKLYLASKSHILGLCSAALAGFGLGVNNLTFGAICLVASVVLDYISFKARKPVRGREGRLPGCENS